MRSIERQDESYADIDREVEDIIKSFGTMLTDIPYDDYDDVDEVSFDYEEPDDVLYDSFAFDEEYLKDKFYAASVDADYDSELYVEEEYE